MRLLGIVVALVGCTAREPVRQAVVSTASKSPPDLICPASTVSALRGKDPKDGGYRVLQDDAAVDALNAAIKARASDPTPKDDNPRVEALHAAMHDMQSELQACWRDADHPTPETQYQLVLTIFGDAAGSTVTETSVKRIAGTAVVETNARSCVARQFARVALPPGGGAGELHMVVRSDFCTTPTQLARGTIAAYVDAFRRWGDDHRGTRCPMALADLDPYARRTNTDDPWSRSYVMRCSSDAFEVLSAGPDRELGTADDLTSRR
jgi:hypothetical protein